MSAFGRKETYVIARNREVSTHSMRKQKKANENEHQEQHKKQQQQKVDKQEKSNKKDRKTYIKRS